MNAELWLEMVNNPNIFDMNGLIMGARLGGRDTVREVRQKQCINTGRSGVLVGAFPFSYVIYQILEGEELRVLEEIKGKGEKGAEEEYLERLFVDVFGQNLSSFCGGIEKEGIKEGKNGEEEKDGEKRKRVLNYPSRLYFHDFVAMNALALPSFSFHEEEFVYMALMLAWNQDCMKSLPTIHLTFWEVKPWIQRVRSLMSSIKLAYQMGRIEIYQKIHESLRVIHTEIPLSCEMRVIHLLKIIVEMIIRLLWEKAAELFTGGYSKDKSLPQSIRTFDSELSSLFAEMTNLSHSLSSSLSAKANSIIGELARRWNSVQFFNILFEELVPSGEGTSYLGDEGFFFLLFSFPLLI